MNEEVDLEDLEGAELEGALALVPWYVQPNDLIGGWCVMAVNQPPSEGEKLLIADCFSSRVAHEIVEAHNARLKSPYAPVDGHRCDQPHPDFPERLCHREIYHAPHAVESGDGGVSVWTDEYKGEPPVLKDLG